MLFTIAGSVSEPICRGECMNNARLPKHTSKKKRTQTAAAASAAVPVAVHRRGVRAGGSVVKCGATGGTAAAAAESDGVVNRPKTALPKTAAKSAGSPNIACTAVGKKILSQSQP